MERAERGERCGSGSRGRPRWRVVATASATAALTWSSPSAVGGLGECLGATHIHVVRVKRKHLELRTCPPSPGLLDKDPLHLSPRARAEREASLMQPISSWSGRLIDLNESRSDSRGSGRRSEGGNDRCWCRRSDRKSMGSSSLIQAVCINDITYRQPEPQAWRSDGLREPGRRLRGSPMAINRSMPRTSRVGRGRPSRFGHVVLTGGSSSARATGDGIRLARTGTAAHRRTRLESSQAMTRWSVELMAS
jgi:hypothetical protein